MTIAGKQVGTVTGRRLTDDGLAELDAADRRRVGAAARAAPTRRSASSASRGPPAATSSCSLPGRRRARATSPTAPCWRPTTPPRTSTSTRCSRSSTSARAASLRGVFRGSARQYAGEGATPRAGWLYLDPALVSASRLFEELNRDSAELRRFVRESSRAGGRRGREARGPRRRWSTTSPTRRARSCGPRGARRGDRAAAAVPAPGQHDLREPARDARRPRAAGRDREAGRQEAAAVHRASCAGS